MTTERYLWQITASNGLYIRLQLNGADNCGWSAHLHDEKRLNDFGWLDDLMTSFWIEEFSRLIALQRRFSVVKLISKNFNGE